MIGMMVIFITREAFKTQSEVITSLAHDIRDNLSYNISKSVQETHTFETIIANATRMFSTIIQSRHHWLFLGRRTNGLNSVRSTSRLVLLETFQSATQAIVVLLLLDVDLIYLVSHKLYLLLQLTEHG